MSDYPAGASEEPVGQQDQVIMAEDVPSVPPPVLGGRYVVVRRIGEGGAAGVYLVYDRFLHQWRAAKVLLRKHVDHDELRWRFLREARMMARLDDPHVVRIYDVADVEQPYLVMEYVSGGCVVDWVRAHGPMPAFAGTKLVTDLCRGLAAIHASGIVHRDIKPHNLLVTARGECKVTDFGIAKLDSSELGIEEDRHTTVEGTAMGSDAFMAPEQRRDAGSVDFRADIYSAGATLYAICTRKAMVDLFMLREGDAPLEDLPEPLRPVLLTACHRDPAHRYASAEEMAKALQAATWQLPAVPAESPSLAQPGPTIFARPPAHLESPWVDELVDLLNPNVGLEPKESDLLEPEPVEPEPVEPEPEPVEPKPLELPVSAPADTPAVFEDLAPTEDPMEPTAPTQGIEESVPAIPEPSPSFDPDSEPDDLPTQHDDSPIIISSTGPTPLSLPEEMGTELGARPLIQRPPRRRTNRAFLMPWLATMAALLAFVATTIGLGLSAAWWGSRELDRLTQAHLEAEAAWVKGVLAQEDLRGSLVAAGAEPEPLEAAWQELVRARPDARPQVAAAYLRTIRHASGGTTPSEAAQGIIHDLSDLREEWVQSSEQLFQASKSLPGRLAVAAGWWAPAAPRKP